MIGGVKEGFLWDLEICDGFWQWGLSEDSPTASSGFWRILGYNSTSHPESWMSCIDEGDLFKWMSTLSTIDSNTDYFSSVMRYRSASGHVVSMNCRTCIVERCESGSPSSVVSINYVIEDTTSKGIFRDAFDNSFEPLLIADRCGFFTNVNKKALNLLGYPPYLIVRSKSIWDMIKPEDEESIRSAISKMHLIDNPSDLTFTNRWTQASGKTVDIRVTITQSYNAKGDPSNLLIHLKDVTAINESRQILSKANAFWS